MSYINPVNKPICLQMLCEENYHRLLRLFPALKHPLQEQTLSIISHSSQLKLLEKSPYTLNFTLQSLDSYGQPIQPTINCRFYLDCKSVEVIHIDGFAANLNKFKHDSPRIVLDKKWVLNYFLEQWLDFSSRYLTIPAPVNHSLSA